MKYKVVYFTSSSRDNPVSKFIDSCDKHQQVKILRILKTLEEYGLQAIITHVKKLTGTPFWEIRVLGKDNIRIIYVVLLENYILLLHGFFKKSQKTPLKELKICYQRYEESKYLLTK